jgi:hypothetical protein
MQSLTGGKPAVEVEGSTVRQVVEALDRVYPGMKERFIAIKIPPPIQPGCA